MSQNSSQKKNSITLLDEYDQLSQLYSDAYDRVQSGGTGVGYSGIHYELMEVKCSGNTEDLLTAAKEPCRS